MFGKFDNDKRRITVDIDKPSPYRALWSVVKGSVLCRSIPEVRQTMKGYHLIWWTERAKTEEDKFNLRERIGDDPKRIEIDRSGETRIRQVLFSGGSKTTRSFNYIPNFWFKSMGHKKTEPEIEISETTGRTIYRYNKCPCGKKITESICHWNNLIGKYLIEVKHTDGSPPCEYPLTHGIRLLARRMIGRG